jgi:hypothetical protein
MTISQLFGAMGKAKILASVPACDQAARSTQTDIAEPIFWLKSVRGRSLNGQTSRSSMGACIPERVWKPITDTYQFESTSPVLT